MKNLINKVIEVKKLHGENSFIDNEPKVVISSSPDNLTPLMKTKLNNKGNIKLGITADDSVISKTNRNGKRDSLSLNKDVIPSKNIEDIIIKPSSYILKNGTINFSKLLIDEVLAADKLLVEAAKLTYDIAGNNLFLSYLYNFKYCLF